MSEEIVQLTRETNDAIRRGDWDAVAATLDPDILVRTDATWPERRTYGREAVIEWYRSGLQALGRDVRIEEIEDLGDRVISRVRIHVRGEHSGVEGELGVTVIDTYRDGRLILEEYFADHAQALAALGIRA
jgi:ketosteroid isomerase-like protein